VKALGAERLEQCLERRPTVVGIGSRWHADDAAGPAVVSRVSGRVSARCIDAGDAPERHLGEVVESGPDVILLLDAVDFGGAPGEVALFTAEEFHGRLSTTHRSSLRLLMRYLEAESSADVLLVGIQPASVAFGEPMSAAVTASVDALAGLLEAKLGGRAAAALTSAVAAQASSARSQKGGQDHSWR
jgi:hydrogenase 3 maturation protease